MSDAMIEIRGLYKIFGGNPEEVLPLVRDGMSKQELLESRNCVLGLSDINISVPPESIQVVMGLSGSGKSTLIRHINRLIEPTAGDIIVDGANVPDMSAAELQVFRREKASMVFQRFALLPHRTVAENVAYGLRVRGTKGREATERAMSWIERVGLEGFENRYPGDLSGGMQQRVGLARALATDPDILLMDEAFSALDPLIRTDMQSVLLDLQKELHKTIVFITHDLDEALRIGDAIAILRDGEVIQQGTAQDIVLSPADDYISDFVRDINRARVVQVGGVMDTAVTDAEGPSVAETAVLEEAAQALAEAGVETAVVTDADGRPTGTVNRTRIMDAMVRPE